MPSNIDDKIETMDSTRGSSHVISSHDVSHDEKNLNLNAVASGRNSQQRVRLKSTKAPQTLFHSTSQAEATVTSNMNQRSRNNGKNFAGKGSIEISEKIPPSFIVSQGYIKGNHPIKEAPKSDLRQQKEIPSDQHASFLYTNVYGINGKHELTSNKKEYYASLVEDIPLVSTTSPSSTLLPNLSPSSLPTPISDSSPDYAPPLPEYCFSKGIEQEILKKRQPQQRQRNVRRKRNLMRRRYDSHRHNSHRFHNISPPNKQRFSLRKDGKYGHPHVDYICHDHSHLYDSFYNDSKMSTPSTVISSDEMSSSGSSVSSITPTRFRSPEWDRQSSHFSAPSFQYYTCNSSRSYKPVSPSTSSPSYIIASSPPCPLKRRPQFTSPHYTHISSPDLHHEYDWGRIGNIPNPSSFSRRRQRGPNYLFLGIFSIGIIFFTVTAMIVSDRLIVVRMEPEIGTLGPQSDFNSKKKNDPSISVRRAVVGLRPLSPLLSSSTNSLVAASSSSEKKKGEKKEQDKTKEEKEEKEIMSSKINDRHTKSTSLVTDDKKNSSETKKTKMQGEHRKGKKAKAKSPGKAGDRYPAVKRFASPWGAHGRKKGWGPESRLYYDDNKVKHNHKTVEFMAKEKPQVIYLHEQTESFSVKSREIEQYPAVFSDNTQLYPVLDSNDHAASSMEMREPYQDDECVPMKEWQTTFHPSCNSMHEIDLIHHSHPDSGGNVHLFGTKGYWRNAWKIDFSCKKVNATSVEECEDSLVLKTLKYQHNFEDAHFEHDRIDAVAMERLTSSPHVINIFGFCAHSVLTEFADGQRVGTLADKSKRKPLARLKIARDIASGLADVHGIDGDEQVSFVHFDVNPANVVSIGGTLKLNDFNIGIMLKKNETSGKSCGFPANYPNPQWRSPEEANGSHSLTEKVDVFSMGHIFFRLICLHEPWHKLEPGGKPTKEHVNEQVKLGKLPFIPRNVLESDDEEVAIIRDVMLECYSFDPKKRPSARSIADRLDKALSELSENISRRTQANKKIS